MEEVQNKEFLNFVKRIWSFLINRKQEESIPHETVIIAPVNEAQIALAKKAGMDIDGYNHILTTSSLQHIMKRHGNQIKAEDFEDVPDILDTPDYIIAGVKVRNEKRIIYAKHYKGTTFYIEQQQTGQKSLAAVSFYKAKEKRNINTFMGEMETRGKYDFSEAEKFVGADGSQPT